MMLRLLKPAEFCNLWPGAVERLKQDVIELPPPARTWLAEAGLPSPLIAEYGDVASRLSFSRLAQGVTRLSAESFVGPPVPSAWAQYWVIGDEEFPNGSAQWCIHETTGWVVRVDVELDHPVANVNGSVAALCSGLVALVEWSRGVLASGVSDANPGLRSLSAEIVALDPAAVGGFWGDIAALEYPNSVAFRMLPGDQENLTSGPTKGSS